MSSNTNYSGTTQHHNGENKAQLPNGCIFIYFIVILISRRKTLFKRNAVTKGHPAKKKPCKRAFGCCVEGHGLAGTIGEGHMVGLDDPVGLFQP